MTRNKYGAKKTTVAGQVFDSQHEARVWLGLHARERAGEIGQLERQVKLKIDVNGWPICTYIADFCYQEDGRRVVADAKSRYTRTLPVYRLKKKLVRATYGVEITEL